MYCDLILHRSFDGCSRSFTVNFSSRVYNEIQSFFDVLPVSTLQLLSCIEGAMINNVPQSFIDDDHIVIIVPKHSDIEALQIN